MKRHADSVVTDDIKPLPKPPNLFAYLVKPKTTAQDIYQRAIERMDAHYQSTSEDHTKASDP